MTRPGDKLHVLYGTNLGSSAKAVKFKVELIGNTALDVPKTEWFPFSMVTNMTTQKEDITDYDEITVKEWILEQKNMMKLIENDELPPKQPMPTKVDKHGFDDYEDDIPF